MTVSSVGRPCSAARPAARYSASCAAAAHRGHRLPQPARGGVRSGVEPRGDLGAQARHRGGQFVGAARRLAQPEGNGRRLSVGVLDAHRAALDAQ